MELVRGLTGFRAKCQHPAELPLLVVLPVDFGGGSRFGGEGLNGEMNACMAPNTVNFCVNAFQILLFQRCGEIQLSFSDKPVHVNRSHKIFGKFGIWSFNLGTNFMSNNYRE